MSSKRQCLYTIYSWQCCHCATHSHPHHTTLLVLQLEMQQYKKNNNDNKWINEERKERHIYLKPKLLPEMLGLRYWKKCKQMQWRKLRSVPEMKTYICWGTTRKGLLYFGLKFRFQIRHNPRNMKERKQRKKERKHLRTNINIYLTYNHLIPFILIFFIRSILKNLDAGNHENILDIIVILIKYNEKFSHHWVSEILNFVGSYCINSYDYFV